MSKRLALWFPLGLTAMLALLTFWLDRTVQEPQAKRDGSTRHDPDYWVDNFHARQMGKDGLLVHTLTATRMAHYPDDDTTRLTQPHFTAISDNRVPTHIRARQGVLTRKGEDIHLTQGVEIQHDAGSGKNWLSMSTDSLHIVPDRQTASTNQAVTIRTPAAVITATGMEMNNRTRVVKLLSRVKGHYEKPKT